MENHIKQEVPSHQVEVTVADIEGNTKESKSDWEPINRLSSYRLPKNLVTVKTEPLDQTRYKNDVYKDLANPLQETKSELVQIKNENHEVLHDLTLGLNIKWKNDEFNESSDSSDEFIETDNKTETDSALVKEDMEFEDHDVLSNVPETKGISQECLFECNLCDYKTTLKNNLEVHCNTHDPSKLLWYYCTKCRYKTRQRGHLSRHDLIHRQVGERELFTCAICDYKFKQKCTLKRHIINIHTDIKTERNSAGSRQLYKCNECSYTTSKRGLLSSHLDKHKDMHDIQSLYICDICSFFTKYRRNLRVHLETHKESQELQIYECKICRFKTRMGYCLKRHFLSKKHLRTVGKLEEYCPRTMKLKQETESE